MLIRIGWRLQQRVLSGIFTRFPFGSHFGKNDMHHNKNEDKDYFCKENPGMRLFTTDLLTQVQI